MVATVSKQLEDENAAVDAIARGGNALLARVAAADLHALLPFCKRRHFVRGDRLIEVGETSTRAHFIERGVASIIKPTDGERTTEIGLVGPEGFVGSAIVMSDGWNPYETIVQCDQMTVLSVEATAMRDLFDGSRAFRSLLLEAVEMNRIQVAESLATALWQPIKARLARWLLMYRDRLRSDRLEVTHDFMALMVGAQRPRITATLHELEGEGAISATRGLVIVRDAARLEELSQGGYGELERRSAGL